VISESENANAGVVQQEGSISIGLGGVSNKFVWQNVGSFLTSQQRFYDVCSP
jgi:hypothetical protein